MKHFWGSILVTVVGLIIAFYFGGRGESFSFSLALSALFICSVLAVMEVSLSFDNAVVNAKVLKDMNAFWRKMFLTVGMIIAVFGMRLLLPIAIVALASGTGYWETTQMALNDPGTYAKKLHDCHISIAAFGGIFLLLVFLNFIFDHERDIHWISFLERRLGKVGKIDTAATIVALLCLLALAASLPEREQQFSALIAGIIGIILYLMLDGVKALTSDSGAGQAVAGAGKAGFAAFCYLEVLDASFSLDGVVGAFALSKNVVIIMVGLAIGAMFVRSMTIYLVEKGTLDEFCFLEHGAHWAIGALAAMMLIGAHPSCHIPEWITGLSGAILIVLSIGSSIRERRKAAAD
ncbi:MAG: hypothetical protein RL095_208 [Verrucomicrobiota bacterium]|jgi:hypothetical protein